MSETDKTCYNDTYAPNDKRHNCMLQQYDEENQSSFISIMTWRKTVTYLTIPVAVPIAFGLSKLIQTHNMMASNNLGLFQHLGILAIPILAPINKWPLAMNDFIYSISGIDWILNDFQTLNYLFGSKTTTIKDPAHKISNNHQKTLEPHLVTHKTTQTREEQSQDTKSELPEDDKEYITQNIEDIENYLLTLGDDSNQEEDPFTFQ